MTYPPIIQLFLKYVTDFAARLTRIGIEVAGAATSRASSDLYPSSLGNRQQLESMILTFQRSTDSSARTIYRLSRNSLAPSKLSARRFRKREGYCMPTIACLALIDVRRDLRCSQILEVHDQHQMLEILDALNVQSQQIEVLIEELYAWQNNVPNPRWYLSSFNRY